MPKRRKPKKARRRPRNRAIEERTQQEIAGLAEKLLEYMQRIERGEVAAMTPVISVEEIRALLEETVNRTKEKLARKIWKKRKGKEIKMTWGGLLASVSAAREALIASTARRAMPKLMRSIAYRVVSRAWPQLKEDIKRGIANRIAEANASLIFVELREEEKTRQSFYNLIRFLERHLGVSEEKALEIAYGLSCEFIVATTEATKLLKREVERRRKKGNIAKE